MSFSISAPGKIILFGEHSVVYGKTAIAASIGLRTRLKFEETETKNAELDFKSINLHHEFKLVDLNLLHHLNKICIEISPKMDIHETYLNSINEFLKKDSKWEKLSQAQKSALTSFVYLFTAIHCFKKHTITRGFKIIVESNLRVGAGLGSSASFSVVLAGCFLKNIYTKQSNDHLEKTQFSSEQLREISQWAYCSERIIHGTPSGLDNCLCTYGSVVRFRRNEEPVVLNLKEGFEALLVDTTVPRQTKVMVSNVRTKINSYPKIANHILDAMDELAKEAERILSFEEEKKTNKYKKLQELVVINQGLLQTIGVSHKTINDICSMAEKRNFAAKLTGAGGGGYCIVVPLNSNEENTIQDLIKDFEKSGFPTIRATLGSPGLIVEELDNS